jgi:hypothetical protein
VRQHSPTIQLVREREREREKENQDHQNFSLHVLMIDTNSLKDVTKSLLKYPEMGCSITPRKQEVKLTYSRVKLATMVT